ncbi:MAG: hypothetical protein COV45_04255 [Deltaproteobacteria bacterium CG11_big_fil_rev_8_21_14_0_20_47_16]|nr:MAG: hypothetical protein COV45_04255 [Deltaproteobacteria bacterium CG11_big_fil_rev_8_21_14_0_20_47_16]
MEHEKLTFTLPDCLQTDTDKMVFTHQINSAVTQGKMPKLHFNISPLTTDKHVYQAIQIISNANKYLDVTFHLIDDDEVAAVKPETHPATGYLKLCQSWLPNSTIVM